MASSPAPIQHVGVAGLGLLGRGIVAGLLGRGLRVTGYDTDPAARQRLTHSVNVDLAEMVEHLGINSAVLNEWPARYTAADDIGAFADCDLVIESITENQPAKLRFFDELEQVVTPQTLIASNTSAIPIATFQTGRRHPARFLGLHWLEPAHATAFMEIIRGALTTQSTIDAAAAFARAIGKRPVVVEKDVVGFVGNRLYYALLREAFHLVETGVADIETIDRSIQMALGAWIGATGPFRNMDLTGIAAHAAVMKQLFPDLCSATGVPRLIQQTLDAGHTGPRAGQGFYAYQPGEADRWEHLMHRHTWQASRMIADAMDEAEGWRA